MQNNNNNVIAPLLLSAANVYEQHDSAIGQSAKDCLLSAMDKSLTKTGQHVSQCSYLTQAYTQHTQTIGNNDLNSLELIDHVQQLEQHLHWADTDAGAKPKSVQDRLAFVELLGPNGMIKFEHCRVGLFFQRADTDYPNHHHASEELYYIISGRAIWSNDSTKMPSVMKPGEFVHHQSWEPHRMQTNDEPLLAMWCWTGDISFSQYKMIDVI